MDLVGSQNENHLMTAQELLDNPTYSMDGDTLTHLPTGQKSNPRAEKMTIGKKFGVQKGHLGSKMFGSVAAITRR